MSDAVKALVDLLMVDAMCNGEGTGITLPQLKMIRAEVERAHNQARLNMEVADDLKRIRDETQAALEGALEELGKLEAADLNWRKIGADLVDLTHAHEALDIECAALRAERDRLQGTCDQLMADSMRRTEELDQLKLEVELVMKGGK